MDTMLREHEHDGAGERPAGAGTPPPQADGSMAALRRRQARRRRRIAVAGVALLLAPVTLLLLASMGVLGGTTDVVTTPGAISAGSSDIVRPGGGLSDAERSWLQDAEQSLRPVAGSLEAIGDVMGDDRASARVALGDQAAMMQVTRDLATVRQCSGRIQQIGPAPTSRMAPVAGSLAQACTYYEAGAVQVAAAIDSGDGTHVRKAAEAWQLGRQHASRAMGYAAYVAEG